MIGSLGFPELLFILFLALLVFGPKRLPEVGRKLGRALGELRRATTDLKSSFDREMETIERESAVPSPNLTDRADSADPVNQRIPRQQPPVPTADPTPAEDGDDGSGGGDDGVG